MVFGYRLEALPRVGIIGIEISYDEYFRCAFEGFEWSCIDRRANRKELSSCVGDKPILNQEPQRSSVSNSGLTYSDEVHGPLYWPVILDDSNRLTWGKRPNSNWLNTASSWAQSIVANWTPAVDNTAAACFYNMSDLFCVGRIFSSTCCKAIDSLSLGSYSAEYSKATSTSLCVSRKHLNVLSFSWWTRFFVDAIFQINSREKLRYITRAV